MSQDVKMSGTAIELLRELSARLWSFKKLVLEHKRLLVAGQVEEAERLNEAIVAADFKLEKNLTDVETLVLEMENGKSNTK